MEEERFAVTAATGALGPVLKKLSALLGDEYKLHEKTREDIVFTKSELQPIHDLLSELWWRYDLDVACMDWMTEARELSYDMEDSIDGFTVGLERGNGSLIQRKVTDSPFKEFMERVKDVSKQCGKMQKIGDAICNRSKLTTDPRALFLHKDASELVGLEKEEEDLIGLLTRYEMVCILGLGGMGKTTLADLVYHAAAKIQCRAFVSLHPNPNMTEILGTILSQVTNGAVSGGSGTEPATEQNMVTDISISLSEKSGTEPGAEQNDIIKGISTFLSDKSYLVIVDDIWHWEVWEVIRKALPKNNRIRRVIMTTRVHSIAEKCENEHGAGVYRQSFGWVDAERLSDRRLSESVEATNAKGLSTKIADMCGEPPFYCCPLAVICLSSAWAESQPVQQGGDGELDTWASHVMGDGFLSTPSLKPLVQSLCLGFDDFPLQLKTCLLYCTIHTMGCWVHDREFLVRNWVAEGFASQVEVAEAYLEELVSRNLLQRESRGLTVDPIMRAFLVCKAKEDNFVAYYNEAGNSSHAKQIRRLCLTTDRYLDEDMLSHTRTLVVSGKQCQLDGVSFKAFKKLRVLVISGIARTHIQNGHLVDICGLIWLKYLAILGCDEITELPREIGRLPNLETLDVRWTRIGKLPKGIVKLHRLQTLDVSHTEVTELPPWIGILPSLKTLNVSDTRVAMLPEEINDLERLETLDISDTKVAELHTRIKKLKSLKTLNIKGAMVTQLPREIGNLERLEILDIRQTLVRELPKEIRKLQHLRTLDISETKVRELPWEVQNSINVRVAERHYAKTVKLAEAVLAERVITSSGANCRGDLFIVFFHPLDARCEEPLEVPLLRVDGRHLKVPQWFKQDLRHLCSLDIRLCKLGEDDLEFLKQMPNLQSLFVRFEVLLRAPIVITGGGFSKLETFSVDCRLPRVTFKREAMPKLKHLEFKFYTGTANQGNSMDIAHLQSLEEVVFRCSEHYSCDGPSIRATIDAVRNEVAKHPNQEISLWVNDDNIFVRHARDKEKEALMEAEERRKSHLLAAEKRAQQDKYRGRGGIHS